MKSMWVMMSLVMLSGCGSLGFDAVKPDNIGEQIFVVTPANQSGFQNDFAASVEKYVLGSGMRVVRRPEFRVVRIEMAGSEAKAAGVESEELSGIAIMNDENRITDSYLEMAETNAKYRINTYAWTNKIEIIDVESNQVLSVFQFSPFGKPEADNPVSGMLAAIGFQISPRIQAVTQEQGQNKNKKTLSSTKAQSSPVITVIPVADTYGEGNFAIEVEEILIRLGMYVVRPPAPHYKEKSTSLSTSAVKGQNLDAAATAKNSRRIESFWSYEETPATLIFETDSYGDTVKIIDKNSKEVKSVISLRAQRESNIIAVRNALISVGISVQYTPPEKKQSTQQSINVNIQETQQLGAGQMRVPRAAQAKMSYRGTPIKSSCPRRRTSNLLI